jgi:hypothetical protein
VAIAVSELNKAMLGAIGAAVSIVIANAEDATLVPDVVVAVAVRLWLPSIKAVVV